MPLVGGTVKLSSGYEIPLFGLGTSAVNDSDVMKEAVSTALKDGYRLFDTAKAYGNEKEVGDALAVGQSVLSIRFNT